jgi:hypothetical protein
MSAFAGQNVVEFARDLGRQDQVVVRDLTKNLYRSGATWRVVTDACRIAQHIGV